MAYVRRKLVEGNEVLLVRFAREIEKGGNNFIFIFKQKLHKWVIKSKTITSSYPNSKCNYCNTHSPINNHGSYPSIMVIIFV